MNLKRYWPIVATPIAIVALLGSLLQPSTPDSPIPMKANGNSTAIESALAVTLVEPSNLPRRSAFADKATNARRVTQSTGKIRDAADASRRPYTERWCAGAYDASRGTNFGACR